MALNFLYDVSKSKSIITAPDTIFKQDAYIFFNIIYFIHLLLLSLVIISLLVFIIGDIIGILKQIRKQFHSLYLWDSTRYPGMITIGCQIKEEIVINGVVGKRLENVINWVGFSKLGCGELKKSNK